MKPSKADRLANSRDGGRHSARLTAIAARCTVISLIALHPLPVLAQAAIGVTIYNDGRVLVRRTVTAEISRGTSTQRLPLGVLDPSTVFSLDSSVAIMASIYDGAADVGSTLRRAVGRRLLFRIGTKPDTTSAVVLGVDPERYQLADGSVSFSPPGIPQFPVDLVIVDPLLQLSVRSNAARSQLRLGYFTGGAQWQASYQAVLAAGTAQVAGSAVISTQTLKADNAEIQLLAGSVSRAEPSRMMKSAGGPMMARADELPSAPTAEQKVGEFHLYSLPGRTTLVPGQTSTIALFEPALAKYERTYVVRGAIPYWGGLPQYGEETDAPVQVTYVVQRPRKTEFGDRPLPGGIVRLFQADAEGRQQLIGEAAIDHTPAGEELRLGAGQAFDLSAKRVQMSYSTRRDSVGIGYWQTTATADYRVTLKNASDSAVKIDVLEERGGEWSVVSSSLPPEKLSSTVTRFRVAVPAQGRTVLKYRVKVVW
jgi:hypothetical protein